MTQVRNIYVQSLFSVWERLSDDKKVIYWRRQSLIFIHNIVELEGTWGILSSHQQGLWVTCMTSQAFPKLCAAFNELSLLIESHFWLSKGISLGLEVRWPWELCFEQSASISGRWVETQCVPFRIRKVSYESLVLVTCNPGSGCELNLDVTRLNCGWTLTQSNFLHLGWLTR